MKECASRKAATPRRRWGFLARLFRDHRGNTLAIVGAAMIPLAAMIGSGVDMSRAYMAKTRLQSACDAAALAGRRVMQDDTLTKGVTDEATKFFNFNFPKTTSGGVTRGPYQTAEIAAPTVTRPVAGTVRVSASTTIPTTVMRMFGFANLPLSVTCDASLNFVNTDVMLVLDTTGSMYCNPNESGLCGKTVESSTSRIVALRAAVMALYNELEPTQIQLEANNLRLRYGIVPYSGTVNVGNMITGMNSAYMRSTTPYQTREAYYNSPVYIAVDTPITVTQAGLVLDPGVQRFTTGTSPVVQRLISNTNCTNFGNNNGFTQSGTSPTGGTFTATGVNNDNDVYDPDGAAGLQASAPTAPIGYVRYQFSRNTAIWTTGTANRVCDRNVTITRRSYNTRYKFSGTYRYVQSNFDTSQLRGGSTILATNTAGTVLTAGYYNERRLATDASTTPTVAVSETVPGIALSPATGTGTITWNGCIEERDTLSTIVPSSDLTIPAAAYDLNINLIPNSEETRWRPHWPRVIWHRDPDGAATGVYYGSNTGNETACPTAAKRLQAWTETALQNYVNGLVPRGYTYHDIGIMWGARLLSNSGIFAADNPDTFHGMPVTRHIIFMTDGELTPECDAYTAWGVERNDRRITASTTCGGGSVEADRHMQRFHMACNAARGMGFSVWVIAFGTSLTPDMTACASNPNQASYATDSATLIARFRQIGSNIGALRLTQ